MDQAAQIAQAVLYEGYLLWPYRRSTLKNQKRWTFGGVYPEPYSTAREGDDPWRMQTQCLLADGVDAHLDVRVRFLHVVQRDVGRLPDSRPDGSDELAALELVDELTVDGQQHLAWQESTEREAAALRVSVRSLRSGPCRVEIDIPEAEHVEWLAERSGRRVGALLRRWKPMRGQVEIAAEPVSDELTRVTVSVTNTTSWHGSDREQALLRTLVSTHTVLDVDQGRFVSLTDPPEHWRVHAQQCQNIGAWPVLVGPEGSGSSMLSAPIILYDYPQVAPESPQ
ncbi:MAG: hypothetical protein ACRDT1_04845, partial [Micromonosporaceae bacterium]